MSEPFLAEVRIVGFNFAPRGWAFCDGQVLPINQNQSLYSLLGSSYGGDGRTSFGLPDMRGRTPIHVGKAGDGRNFRLAEKQGEQTHTISLDEMPNHEHVLQGSNDDANDQSPEGNLLGNNLSNPYVDFANGVAMVSGTIANVGGGQGHENMQPFIALNYCIAIQGLFPSRN